MYAKHSGGHDDVEHTAVKTALAYGEILFPEILRALLQRDVDTKVPDVRQEQFLQRGGAAPDVRIAGPFLAPVVGDSGALFESNVDLRVTWVFCQAELPPAKLVWR